MTCFVSRPSVVVVVVVVVVVLTLTNRYNVVVVVVVVVVLTLTHRYNAVRGQRTGSNNSGAEDYRRKKTNTP